MTRSNPTESMYIALQELGEGWHSRAEIAQKLGKKRLFAYQAALLDVLAAEGRIEAEQRPVTGPIGYQWMYRVPLPESSTDTPKKSSSTRPKKGLKSIGSGGYPVQKGTSYAS